MASKTNNVTNTSREQHRRAPSHCKALSEEAFDFDLWLVSVQVGMERAKELVHDTTIMNGISAMARRYTEDIRVFFLLFQRFTIL